ncbi:hypothetical protein IW262DRAFT_190949 [Armillaria fumosa]|nr:hypothetical protein IW262DRAFT_190949 [Armillaria fumosa]
MTQRLKLAETVFHLSHHLLKMTLSSSQHISVETVKSMASNKKISLVEHNFISLAEKMPFSDEYTQIYQDIWCDQQSPFIKEEVLRDDLQSRANVTVPETTWVLSPTPAMTADVLELLQTRPFIREEYGIALRNIIKAAMTGKTKITVPSDRCSDEEFSDEEEESLDVEEQVTSPSSEPTIGMRRTREEDFPDDREKKKQRLDDDKHGELYANPFQGQEIDTKLKGYIVLGHRGIGNLSKCSFFIRPVTYNSRKIHLPLLYPSFTPTSETTYYPSQASRKSYCIPSTRRLLCVYGRFY